MDDLQPIKSLGGKVEDDLRAYFDPKFVEMLRTQLNMPAGNPNIRNADYYASRPVPQIDCCAHCGQPLPEDDPDY